ncbi:hypothetical protein ACIRST_01830 [Kitasatospora sp. NPDC101447]|uniref:hypothetical protein n=1 Tax=Kitasatospora sp. NPDC101447 TaxID=3364102 RepID=UPI003829189B
MNARIEDARPPGRPRLHWVIVRGLARALLVAAGLATVLLAFSWFVDAYRSVDAYRAAPDCGTAAAAPGAPCVRHETGKVTARKVDNSSDSTTYDLTVARETAPGRTFSVGEAFYREAKIGTDVDVKVWNGRPVEVSWHGHRASTPDIPWLSTLKVALLVSAGTALTAYGLAWPRDSYRGTPVVAAVSIFIPTYIGALILCLAQWPLIVTLVIPGLAWLLLTATAVAASREA